MKFRTGLIIGAAVGYYYGSKAGRERFEQIDRVLAGVRSRPRYQQLVGRATGAAGDARRFAGDKAVSVIGNAVAAVLPDEPEPTYEPGLEFNPDFTPTAEEIIADLRGDAPAG
jgi:hypothetical protein